ncbi:MAG TPA: hypothetical protein VLG11_04030 [Candidatus Saccharimonadales bacterium]|nr:hypothetical protein [Candidatus Saccharimonadales bacterium]
MPPRDCSPPIESLITEEERAAGDAQRQLLIDVAGGEGEIDSIAQLDAEHVGEGLKRLLHNLLLVEMDPPKDAQAAAQLPLASKILRAIIEGKTPVGLHPDEYAAGYDFLLASLQKGKILEATRQHRQRTDYGPASMTLGRGIPQIDRSYNYDVPHPQRLSNTDLDPVLAAHFSGVELDVLRDHYGTRGDGVRMPIRELADLYEMSAAEVRAIISEAAERLPKSALPGDSKANRR